MSETTGTGGDGRRPDWRIWRHWVVANGWGELVGLGGSAAVAFLVLGTADDAGVLRVIGNAAFIVVVSTLLEGGVVGVAQWRVLTRVLPRLTRARWIYATALGALVAWTMGMVPSTIMSLQETTGAAGPPELGMAATIGLGFLMGLAAGPVLGFFQWRELRHHVARAIWWIPANALAWACGMAIIMAGSSAVPAGATAATVVAAVALTILAAGAAAGAIHGLVLIRLLPTSASPECGPAGALQAGAVPQQHV
jgi:hypothetical protein